MMDGSPNAEAVKMPKDEKAADQLIASLGGAARAALVQLVALVGTLQREIASLTIAASRGCVRGGIPGR